MRFRHILIIIVLLASGCSLSTPLASNAIKTEGRLVTNEGTADLFILFQPPDKFRIVANHPLASGRILDIGGDGNIIWYKTEESATAIKGKIVLYGADPFLPRPLSFVAPKDLKIQETDD